MMKANRGHSFDLSGRTALVTGSSAGLGLEIAKALAVAGARVYVNGRNHATLEKLANTLCNQGLEVYPLCFDVEDARAADAALLSVSQAHSALDILINNVGVRNRKGMLALTADELQGLFNNHVTSNYNLVKLSLPLLSNSNQPRIINLLSIAAFRAVPGDIAYITAKGALAALTRAQSVELGEYGITVNGIIPGAFKTETNRALATSEQGKTMVASRSSLKRWGEPEEIAGAAVFLASAAASYVTGHLLAVDGGVLAHY